MLEEKNESPVLVKWVAIILWIALGIQWAFLMPNNGLSAGSAIGSQARNLKITDPVSAPIILMGLPRSGSLALHEYFQCQGMTSRHYCCGSDDDNVTNNHNNNMKTSFPCPKHQETCGNLVLENLKQDPAKKAFDGMGGTAKVQVWSAFDVETDQGWFLPQHFALGLLHKQYPNAIWILNTRGTNKSKDWANSVYHWHSLTRRFLHSFGHLNENQGIWDDLEPGSEPKPDLKAHVTAEQVQQDLERSVARTSPAKLQAKGQEIKTSLEEIYQKHTDTIRNWGQQFPSHRLMEINVDEDASTIQSKLDQAFGINYSHQSGSNDCRFQFVPPDNDWQDFSLPY